VIIQNAISVTHVIGAMDIHWRVIMNRVCTYCNRTESDYIPESEIRPYGRNGSNICYECGMKPDNYKTVESQFNSRMSRCGDTALIGGPYGPVPISTKINTKN